MRFILFIIIPLIGFSQNKSIGVYIGPSIGYNSVYDNSISYSSLFDFSLGQISKWDDNDMSFNNEIINGFFLGIRSNLLLANGFAIQPEIQYQKIEFNHIVLQKGIAVFNDPFFSISGLLSDDYYKIATYGWNIHYINFPFLLKLYPVNKFFMQIGAKFGFVIKAEENLLFSRFDVDNQYVQNSVVGNTIIYDFFESNNTINNHGFDTDEWPFNFQTSAIFGIGFESNSFYFSLRYELGLSNFFNELNENEDGFFDNYNIEIDENIFSSFNYSEPIYNNNFKLNTLSLVIGFQLSSD